MDTQSLYLALAEKEQEDCIRPKMDDSFTSESFENFVLERAVSITEKTSKILGFSKKWSDVEMLCLCSKI